MLTLYCIIYYWKLKMTSILDQVLEGFPNSEFVKIKNVCHTAHIIAQMKERGPDSLQFITDFDRTLTCYKHKGVKCQTCYELFSNNPLLPIELTERLTRLYNKNADALMDKTLSIQEKSPIFETFYRNGHEILTSYKIKKSLLHKIVLDSHELLLRDKATDMIQMLAKAEIPLLIFSGGLGNFIEDILRNCDSLGPNLKIVANYMEFDEGENLIGFLDPLVHPYNKCPGISPKTFKYFAELVGSRTNGILLGDSLADISMSQGIFHSDSVLKIGFLNHKIEECMDEFMENFDIVLVDYQSMEFVNVLLKHLLKKN